MTTKKQKKEKKYIYISILEKNMVEEASPEFRLRKIDETKNYTLDEIKHNDLTSGKDKKTCKYLNYVQRLLILALNITGCILIFAFAFNRFIY